MGRTGEAPERPYLESSLNYGHRLHGSFTGPIFAQRLTKQPTTMSTPAYTLHSTNFDHEPRAFQSFKETIDAAKLRGFEAYVTDGQGEVLATWSPISGLRMVQNKYSA
jgi:hypothetical protein